MSWHLINGSKYYHIEPNKAEPVGICDRSGGLFKYKDLKKQMEWMGNRLQWTGLMVGEPFLDEPNPQNRTPHIPPDVIKLNNPRPGFNYTSPGGRPAPTYSKTIEELLNVRFNQ